MSLALALPSVSLTPSLAITLVFAACSSLFLQHLLLLKLMMVVVQFTEEENGHRSSSDELTPDEVDSKLLRKQLLEVSERVIPGNFSIGAFFRR